MKRIFILFTILLVSFVVNAQGIKNVNKWFAKGERAEKKDKYEKAIYYYTLVEQAYNECGTIDDKLASALSALSFLYYDEGDYFKAVEYGTKDMLVNKALFGENHPNYATSLADLALFYSYLGDYSKALECEAKALEIRKVVLGEKHLDYATSLSDLADIYSDLGDYSKALELGEKALEIRRDVLGENHSD